MRSEIVLTYRDEDGAWREVKVAQKRFTIGSGADNDLVIRAPVVSRRHAVIENHDGSVLAYDCQSQHGTQLNSAPLRGSASLYSGDLLTLGGAYDISVKLRAPFAAPARDTRAAHAVPPPSFAPSGINAPTLAEASPAPPINRVRPPIAIAAVAVLVVLALGFILLARRPTPPGAGGNSAPSVAVPPALATGSGVPSAGEAGNANDVNDVGGVGDEELERAAVRVVQRASGQSRPYAFPPEALRDIGQQVARYRQSDHLRDAFVSLQRGASSVAAQAREIGVEPDLVIYVALARSDSGGDANATARALIPQLAQLRETFGGNDPDGSLIIVAAYTDGVGSRQSHPLLVTIRRLVERNPFAERNVWFLREQGGLRDAAYDFVIRTIAAGVVAQNPRRNGIAVEPLVY